jgi:hypothetical protein
MRLFVQVEFFLKHCGSWEQHLRHLSCYSGTIEVKSAHGFQHAFTQNAARDVAMEKTDRILLIQSVCVSVALCVETVMCTWEFEEFNVTLL